MTITVAKFPEMLAAMPQDAEVLVDLGEEFVNAVSVRASDPPGAAIIALDE